MRILTLKILHYMSRLYWYRGVTVLLSGWVTWICDLSMQISPLGGWLVSALPIHIGGECHKSNTNSSILLQCKNKLQVHIKLTPTKQDPKQSIVCTTVCALQNIIISIVFEIKIQ